jgi:hypothetical protein
MDSILDIVKLHWDEGYISCFMGCGSSLVWLGCQSCVACAARLAARSTRLSGGPGVVVGSEMRRAAGSVDYFIVVFFSDFGEVVQN